MSGLDDLDQSRRDWRAPRCAADGCAVHLPPSSSVFCPAHESRLPDEMRRDLRKRVGDLHDALDRSLAGGGVLIAVAALNYRTALSACRVVIAKAGSA